MSARRAATRQQRPRRRVSVAAVALAAVFLIKLAAVLQLHRHPLLQPDAGLDTTVYVELAREVIRGNLELGPGLYFVSPLYIYFLALVLWLTDSFLWVRLVQSLLGTIAVALVFRTAAMWHGRRAAWFAGALATFTGVFTFYEALLLQAGLDPFLTALTLYLLTRALRASAQLPETMRTLPAALCGIAFGVFALNRPNVLIAAAGVTLVLLLTRRWRTALLLAAGVVMALSPVMARNYALAADLAPLSSHGGLNFYIGNNPQADGTYHMVDDITPSIAGQRDDARRVAEQAIGRVLDDSEVSAHFYGLGWKWIASNPAQAAKLFARKLAYVFNAAHLSLNYSYPYYVRDEHSAIRYLPVGAWLLVPLGLAGLWLGAPADPAARRAFWVWASFVPLYAVAVAVFFVSARYRLPILIPLCVTAGGALDALARLRSASFSEHRRRVIVAAVAIGCLTVFANWRFNLDEGRAEERTRMALWTLGQDRVDEAEARVTALVPDHPEPGVLHFRFGRALLARGRADAAIRHLEQARAIDATPEIDFVLGQALLEAGRAKEAVPHLRRALDGGVRPDLAGFDLTRALASSGDRVAALQTLQAVRPARADDGDSWRALGQLALDLQAPRLAEPFLRQAIRVQPDTAENFEQLGLAVALGGRYDEATGSFQRAIALDPSDATAHLNLAVAYAETGRVPDARREAQESLRLDPTYARAKQFLSALDQKK